MGRTFIGNIRGTPGKDGVNGLNARINGVNTLELTTDNGLSAVQKGLTLTITADDATERTPGVVVLTDSTSSTSRSTAATPNSVRQAYDLANSANSLAEDALAFASRIFTDNWYFLNPVNQKRKKIYTGGGYSIDRWRSNFTRDTIEVTENGIQVTVDSTVAGWHFYQIAEDDVQALIGKTITAGFFVGGFGSAESNQNMHPIVSFRDAGGNVISYVEKGLSLSLIEITAPVPEGTATIHVGMYANTGIAAGDYIVLKAIGWEVGNACTFARKDDDGVWRFNRIPNYAEELIKCQRSYRLFSSEAARPAEFVDYQPPMRANPATGTIEIDGVTYYYSDANL